MIYSQALSRMRAAPEGTIDRLESALDAVANAFRDSTGGQQRRCVFIASTGCIPASEDKARKLRELKINVQVILVGSDGNDRDLPSKRLLEWYGFCRASGGWCTLIGARGKPEAADDTLKDQLRALLEQAAQPTSAPAKSR